MAVLTGKAYDGPHCGGEGKGGRPPATSVVLILREMHCDHIHDQEDRDIYEHDPTYDCGLPETHRDHTHEHGSREIQEHDPTYDCGLRETHRDHAHDHENREIHEHDPIEAEVLPTQLLPSRLRWGRGEDEDEEEEEEAEVEEGVGQERKLRDGAGVGERARIAPGTWYGSYYSL